MKKLSAHSTKLTDKGLMVLGMIDGLEILHLGENNFSAYGLSFLCESLKDSGNIKHLHLNNILMDKLSIEEIAVLFQSKNLKFLNLANCNIQSEDFLKVIPDICESSLQAINLLGNSLDSSILSKFSNSLEFSSSDLETIIIPENLQLHPDYKFLSAILRQNRFLRLINLEKLIKELTNPNLEGNFKNDDNDEAYERELDEIVSAPSFQMPKLRSSDILEIEKVDSTPMNKSKKANLNNPTPQLINEEESKTLKWVKFKEGDEKDSLMKSEFI